MASACEKCGYFPVSCKCKELALQAQVKELREESKNRLGWCAKWEDENYKLQKALQHITTALSIVRNEKDIKEIPRLIGKLKDYIDQALTKGGG